jgi:hypothetical protein
MNDIYSVFKDKYPDYTIEIFPPCISENREEQYRIEVMQVALGLHENNRVYVNHETKKFFFER